MRKSLQPNESNLGVSDKMKKLAEYEELVNRLKKEIKDEATLMEQNEREKDRYVMSVITEYLQRLGFSASVKGYRYARCGILMALKNPEYLEEVTKRLYPEIGKKFSSTGSRVERAIRHAITSTWEKGWADPEFVETKLHNTFSPDRKPTNSEFLATIVDTMRMDGICYEALKMEDIPIEY